KAEEELVLQSRQLYLTGKLLEFALTSEEWGEYKKVRSPQSVVRSLNLDINYGLRTAHRGLILPFESFYLHAEARDKAIVENLRKAMVKHNAKRVVLVTGGFHTKGILKHLQYTNHGLRTTDSALSGESAVRSPWSVVDFVPKVTVVNNGSEYLSVFTQEKSPLDRLFTGEKLFLARLIQPQPLTMAATAAAAGIRSSVDPKQTITTNIVDRSLAKAPHLDDADVTIDDPNPNTGEVTIDKEGQQIVTTVTKDPFYVDVKEKRSYWNQNRKVLLTLATSILLMGVMQGFLPSWELLADGHAVTTASLVVPFPDGAVKEQVEAEEIVGQFPIGVGGKTEETVKQAHQWVETMYFRNIWSMTPDLKGDVKNFYPQP
ncbi:hypothetical protein BVX98_03385, partial [bacterium F11]